MNAQDTHTAGEKENANNTRPNSALSENRSIASSTSANNNNNNTVNANDDDDDELFVQFNTSSDDEDDENTSDPLLSQMREMNDMYSSMQGILETKDSPDDEEDEERTNWGVRLALGESRNELHGTPAASADSAFPSEEDEVIEEVLDRTMSRAGAKRPPPHANAPPNSSDDDDAVHVSFNNNYLDTLKEVPFDDWQSPAKDDPHNNAPSAQNEHQLTESELIDSVSYQIHSSKNKDVIIRKIQDYRRQCEAIVERDRYVYFSLICLTIYNFFLVFNFLDLNVYIIKWLSCLKKILMKR